MNKEKANHERTNKSVNKDLKDFYILWSTQSLSQLGSAITAFALTLWLYEKTGSALNTAALRIFTYAPYVIMSIFAGALTDKFDKKKTMLICDLLAALTTVAVFVLYKTDTLSVWHLYLINAVSGLMNTVQQPASEVAYTMVIPKEHYQKTSGLQQLSRSLVTIGNPLIAAAVYGLAGLDAAIVIDLISFAVAFIALACFITIPEVPEKEANEGSVLSLAKEGLVYLKDKDLCKNKFTNYTICGTMVIRRIQLWKTGSKPCYHYWTNASGVYTLPQKPNRTVAEASPVYARSAVYQHLRSDKVLPKSTATNRLKQLIA